MAASSGNGGGMSSVIGILTNIDQHLSALIDRIRESRGGMEVPGSTSSGGARGFLGSITVQIAKLADTINVRSEDDIDEMADKVAKEICRSNCKIWDRRELMKERIIELSVDNRSEVIELPINPKTVEFTSKQLNQTITLLEMGEVNLAGDRGLKRTKFSSFFPSENSPFSDLAEDTPKGYITMLDEWKTSKKVVRVIVTDMDINLAMLIDELNYSVNEGDEDIYYTMSFQSTLL